MKISRMLPLLTLVLLIAGQELVMTRQEMAVPGRPSQPPHFSISGRSDETQLYVRTSFGDGNWDDRFDALGVDGIVYAMAANGSDVYVGGDFTSAGGVTNTLNIARWNSTAGAWAALGSGVNGPVYAIAVSGSNVYVGGNFTSTGGVTNTFNIARWNSASSTWSALGSGASLPVYALAASGSDVYVGGGFSRAGGVDVNYIARWDGSSWSAMGNGMNDEVRAIAVSGTDIYVGGKFTYAGGQHASCIARWDGSTWWALGAGVNNDFNPCIVSAIMVDGSVVYVGGDFNKAGGMPSFHLARWSGFWLPQSGSVDLFGALADVQAIAVIGDKVYVGGYIYSVGSIYANGIAQWTDTSGWSALGSGVGGTGGMGGNPVFAIAPGIDGVYVGGDFMTAGVKPSQHFGLWHELLYDNFVYLPLVQR